MNKTVLVVDDSEEVVELLSCFFGDKHTLFRAYSGKEAFEIFLAESPNLIITDLAMPGWDGFKLISEIRQQSTVKIIAVSGLKALEAQKAMDCGANYVVTKPLDIPSFLNLTKEALRS